MTQPLRTVDLLPIPSTEGAEPQSRGLGGLLALSAGAERAFPLLGVKVRASIVGPCARTVIEQRFHNPLSVTLDVVHIFPLPEDGAVVEVELVCGDLIVRAECQEREQAAARFAEARPPGTAPRCSAASGMTSTRCASGICPRGRRCGFVSWWWSAWTL